MKEVNNGRRIEKQRKPKWQIAVEAARSEALALSEAEAIDSSGQEAMSQFLAGVIDGNEYRALVDLHDEDSRGQVEFEDSNSLRYVLEWVLGDRDLVDELVRHEEEHYQEAQAQGLSDVSFLIRFFRDDKNVISLRAAIKLHLPDDMDDGKLRTALRSIVEAPEEMSDSDLCMVEPHTNKE